ncbi:MAPEG family protein [Dichotomicrobium thermohalophilum]|uniref:Putative MAPEG superfamily protein n=1 Tax=Dichotomicrobium thermohalophilum TaxID=933063 RepID=A0A397Q7B9_9HYPH|nr:MAPEG family protein [Dichotomicrobium thermohalophilum]RIA56379.1 putative MAPEG superfamily protein [Dichotomicrobium thermohalophilum]
MGGDLTIELTVLVLAVLLAYAQLTIYAIYANRDYGPDYTMSPRDSAPARPASVMTGRLRRAYENHLESLPWFAIAVLVAQVSGTTSWITAAASLIYLAARIVYIPCYALGWRLRSLVWSVAALAILVILGDILI